MDISYYKKYEPIDGKWYITKELGSGSFGKVFEVERKDFGNMKSAMKIISVPSTESEIHSFRSENYDMDDKSVTSYFYGFVEEFIKEFQIMSQLKGHSNIVNYEDHDVKKKEDGIGWDIFIRMELLKPMNDYFKEHMPTQSDVIKLGIDMCKALEVCQKHNIIHRDIKPSNIFVSDNGDFKLGDFGVARTLEKTSSGLSKKGTYTYMAPEVFKGESYGASVDTYSLAIVMYKLLNNNLEPFRKDRTYSDSETALARRMKGEKMPAPQNADAGIAKVILKACSYNPADRYSDPAQMRNALEKINYTKIENNSAKADDYRSDDKQNIRSYEDMQGTVSMFSKSSESGGTVSMFSAPKEQEQGTVSMFGSVSEKADVSKNETPNQYAQAYQTQSFANTMEVKPDRDVPFTTYAINSYVSMWKRIVDFKGVTSRKAYWSAVLVNAVAAIVLIIASFATGGILQPLCQLYTLATFIPGLSMCTRRLHDTGRSGHWQWLFLTVYGSIAVLVFCCMQGKKENNKYLNRLSEDK